MINRALLLPCSSMLASAIQRLAILLLTAGLQSSLSAASSAADFKKQIRPLLSDFCLKCHSTAIQKGDLDLEQFTTLDEVKRSPKVWQNVAEQLADREMPPKDKPQPSDRQRDKLLVWVKAMLGEMARARAGDPGPVVLRRLSNAEYTYTLHDLTGLETLDPAREFPVDGAAGEGFMNVGNALVMSPSLLTKYLDAGKEVANHAVLLPDGIRFSAKTTRRDWSEEILGEIRGFYRDFTDPTGSDKRTLQGTVTDTKAGRIPLEKYLKAMLELPKGGVTESFTRARGLNDRYFGELRTALLSGEPSFILDPMRARLRSGRREDIPALVADIEGWQKALWKFNSVGHIGKADGPKEWMEPVTPIAARKEVRLKIAPPKEGDSVPLYLTVGENGDGNKNDFAIWREPKLVMPGRPDLLLRDVREVTRLLTERRPRIFSQTTNFLAAVAEAAAQSGPSDAERLARKYGVEKDALDAWLAYLGLGGGDAATIASHLTNQVKKVSGFDFINGWGSPETPIVAANSSDQSERIPGNVAPHGFVMHPSRTLQVAVGWRSPISGRVRVQALIHPAHPECGNGVTWSLELRRGQSRRRLAAGLAQGSKDGKPAIENLMVRAGDLISVLTGPRDGDHSCDLTALEFTIASATSGGSEWNLGNDVSSNILAGNPHADRFGNDGVWHFYTEPATGGSEAAPVIPPGSTLARWDLTDDAHEKNSLANDLQKLLTAPAPAEKESPDAQLYQQLWSLGGPLLTGLLPSVIRTAHNMPRDSSGNWGLDAKQFGKHPDGSAVDPGSLCAQAPSIVEIRLPAELAAGCEFVTTGELEAGSAREGSVQMQALFTKPLPEETPVAGGPANPNATIVVNDNSHARQRLAAALEEFRRLFPAALCYSQIVPVDEVITLRLFYRDDRQLSRLMLDEAQQAELDWLWNALHFVSQDALTEVDAFEQILQFETQVRPKDSVSPIEPLRKSIMENADRFRQNLVEAEPLHLQAALELAEKAYRRPLPDTEKENLRGLYRKLREQEWPHDEAIRLILARILVAPAFLYHVEKPGPGAMASPVDDWELASRLSYFLWSSAPDAELRQAASEGKLRDSKTLVAQTHRLLRDPRMRRMAKEFGAVWLHIYGFDELGEKSERHFPTFQAVRGDMYEESIRFFADLFQRDGSVLEILDADHTFLNEALAKHYGIPGVTGDEWRRVDGVKKFGRGGVLGLGATLAKQSGASRTSPILRGSWLSETLLGEKLPRPPKDVPQLPDDEATETLTVRELTEKHVSDPRCAGCHQRFDAFGYSLEAFDAIGRHRERDLADRPINTRVTTMDGAKFDGVDGLRHYLLTKRRDAFVQQFCRKLLGYALGRAVQLSDEPLLKEMSAVLKANDYRISSAINVIVRSRQFRQIRGRETAYDE